MNKPIIGITSGETLSERYIEAVTNAGGIPVILKNDGDPKKAVKDCGGIILSGGGDILPELFGVNDYDPTLIRGTDIKRDEFELRLAKLAYESKTPTLGICRGIQVMNAALGGTLIFDLPGHSQKSARDIPTHDVIAAGATLLAAILGTKPGERLAVNSFHHQAVGRISERLRLSAASADGVIEGIEAKDPDRFFVGVQWHPECLRDRASERLFSALVKAAVSR